MNSVRFHPFSLDLRLEIREGLDSPRTFAQHENDCFVLMVAKSVLHLWYNITAVHEPKPHVLSVARIGLHHHGGALEDSNGGFCRRRLLGILR